jgi:hypothetical protein
VPALVTGELAELADVRVHIDMPETQRLESLRRDYRWRGEADAAVDALIASRARDESPPVLEAALRADFVVSAWIDQ